MNQEIDFKHTQAYLWYFNFRINEKHIIHK